MKRLLFSLYFVSHFASAQIETVFDKSIDVSNFNNLSLDIKNIPLDIRLSIDDKIHLDFKLELTNFTKKEKDSIINQIKFEQNVSNDKLAITIESEEEVAKRKTYSKERITNKEISKLLKETVIKYMVSDSKRKTKEKIINNHKGFLEGFSKYFELKAREIKKKKLKLSQCFFTVYLPRKLLNNLTFKAKHSRLNFGRLEMGNLNLFTDGGYLNISKLTKSKITCWNGSVFLPKVESSIIIGRSTNSILIGGIENSNLITEHTKVEIGEVGEYNDIKDFGSRFYLYNFVDDFKKMNFKGEYSKIYFYEPNNDYKLLAYGNTSVFKYGEIEAKVEPNKGQNKTHMFGVKRKYKKPYAGELYFDIENTEFTIKDFKKEKF